MKSLARYTICLLTVGFLALYLPAAFASEGAPTCSLVKLSSGSIAAGIGYSWGHGKLDYNGRQYLFKISGLDVGSVGIREANSTGTVCNLARLEDFNGTYATPWLSWMGKRSKMLPCSTNSE